MNLADIPLSARAPERQSARAPERQSAEAMTVAGAHGAAQRPDSFACPGWVGHPDPLRFLGFARLPRLGVRGGIAAALVLVAVAALTPAGPAQAQITHSLIFPEYETPASRICKEQGKTSPIPGGVALCAIKGKTFKHALPRIRAASGGDLTVQLRDGNGNALATADPFDLEVRDGWVAGRGIISRGNAAVPDSAVGQRQYTLTVSETGGGSEARAYTIFVLGGDPLSLKDQSLRLPRGYSVWGTLSPAHGGVAPLTYKVTRGDASGAEVQRCTDGWVQRDWICFDPLTRWPRAYADGRAQTTIFTYTVTGSDTTEANGRNTVSVPFVVAITERSGNALQTETRTPILSHTEGVVTGQAEAPADDEQEPEPLLLKGTSGNDTLTGKGGDDELVGRKGDDTLYGRGGHDVLKGGAGDDDLYGEAGNDELRGWKGDDDYTGGPGDDRFVFSPWETGDKVITDFGDGDDVIVLLVDSSAGPWPQVTAILGSQTQTQSGTYVYDLRTGLTLETHVQLADGDIEVE